MTPAQLSRTVLLSLHGVADDAGWPVDLPERVVVESPPRRGSGDYATGVLLRLGRRGRGFAGPLAVRLGRERGIGRVEITGPGFVNVTLNGVGRAELVTALVREGARARKGIGSPEAEARDDASPVEDEDDSPAEDAARWAAATTATTATATTPADLLVRTHANPLFRVQYAHARARALLRNGAALGVEPVHQRGSGPHGGPHGGYAYDHPAERALLALLADHDRVARATAVPPGAHARHLTAVADAFFDVHDACPPLPQGDRKPKAAHRCRLALAEAVGTVLAGGLTQLGVTAPAHL
ncbi:arginine--tRNA ligase [Streptomyces sp. N2-109]|uniref:arginine--tRNA ligase n=1 Tax=Streptomyces gossypii TaxID=2883101 RepID=A0ABT2JY40_9ACTN|nr:DALR anticodon-binding domain-containing protein [Streptomyces gossypii]MCT2592369.1 arginine--tRNA ligase [Streptomyces gossypii]